MLAVQQLQFTDIPYELILKFSDSSFRRLNLKPYLWGEVFEPLLVLEQFQQVKVDPESSTIVWPNGADFAPEFLYEQGVPLT